jgi:hypothetical protein
MTSDEDVEVGTLSFRPIREDELELLLAWQSNPLIYEHFREQDGPLSRGSTSSGSIPAPRSGTIT